MKCPICGKDLDLQNKQIGTSENGIQSLMNMQSAIAVKAMEP